MMKNFRVVSVSAMMAAFAATSAWASACPTEKAGWSLDGEDCVYKMPTSGTTTITLPSELKSFKLKYEGDNTAVSGVLHIHCQSSTNTVSVTGSATLEGGGTLDILNRVNLDHFDIPADAFALLTAWGMTTEDIQPTKPMFTCSNKNCLILKKTGLNALNISYESTSGDNKKFNLEVTQEQYNFGPMQVLNVEGIDKSGMLAAGAAMAGVNINMIPDKVNNGLLLRGQYKTDDKVYPLNGLTQDIEVGYVYLDRTFVNSKDGSARSTIAFPFDISPDNIDGVWEILQFTRIGKDAKGNDAVFMKKVYCFEGPDGDKCPAKNGTLEAYKPYIVQLLGEEWTDDGKPATSLTISGGVTLKATTMEAGYADFADPDSWWVFRGVFEKITWDKAPANTYGYAASGKDKDGNDLAGKFVKVGAGAYIYPFRGVLTYAEPLKAAPANSSYALRPNVLPDEMNIVVEGDNNETTVIGSFNTRTGEMKFINNMKHTYDLKGRRVNGVNNARGAYYGKKVMR